MSFYLRKSLRFGPLRLNLSTSGIGCSVGVKGLRIGTGPRGNYIHAGVGGVYYRRTIPTTAKLARLERPNVEQPPSRSDEVEMREVESGSAAQMVDEDSCELLNEINTKRRRLSFAPLFTSLAAITLGILILSGEYEPVLWVTFALFALLGLVAPWWDRRRKIAVVFYHLEEPVLSACEAMHRGFDMLAACRRVWHVEASGDVADRKYAAGASTLVKRTAISLRVKSPPGVRTNVAVACISAGRQHLYLFPDRLLVYDRHGVGAVSYGDLQLRAEATRFIEAGAVPSDSQIVDRTWRYVNKAGGPDRRFANNYDIPVVMYEEMELLSRSGLNEKLQFSRLGVCSRFIHAVATVGNVLQRVQAHGEYRTTPPPLPSPASAYFYYTDTVQGPVSVATLTDLLETDEISRDTLVCTDQDRNWRPLAQVFGS